MVKKILVLPLLLLSTTVFANTYSFVPTNGNQNNQGVTIGNLFQLEVLDLGAGQVSFEFTNDNVLSSSIIAVYIGGPNLFASNTFTESTGVNFQSINTEQPQTGFAIEAASRSVNQGGNNFGNGINQIIPNTTPEFLRYTFTLDDNTTFGTVINNLNSGTLLVGVTGQTNNQANDQYIINTPSAVPLPGAGWLFGSTLIGLMGLRRRVY